MQIFYCETLSEATQDIKISIEETRHITKVLRKKSGDKLYLSNGKGLFAEATITSIERQCNVQIDNISKIENHKNYKLHLAVAPTKMIDRYEWMVEKCMEIGVDRITPILCEHSERKKIKIERLQNILIAAMKQSGNILLPKIDELTLFSDFVNTISKENAMKSIAYCGSYAKKQPFDTTIKQNNNILLIGPEGDFSPKEVTIAHDKGFQVVSLSNSILRVETAAVYSAVCVSLKNDATICVK